ncbi:MAG: hypothetical protein NC453_24835 [Muribaculum sp.]|nr:hypothetical protein [Muribaculum sp.]
MKVLHSLITMLLLAISINISFAQNVNEVTLTVSSDGSTKDEAVKNALRSAIEQSYGTFVSANTTILNDDLVKDEIVTVSNGSIKDYKELSSVPTQNGGQFVTLQATVSLSHLIKYAQSKGSECEFAGNTLASNLKLWELNKRSERKVIENLKIQMREFDNLCDYKLEIGEPTTQTGFVEIPFSIEILANENTANYFNSLFGVLSGISAFENSIYKMWEKDETKKVYHYSLSKDRNKMGIYLRDHSNMYIIDEIMSEYEEKIKDGLVISDNMNTPTKADVKMSKIYIEYPDVESFERLNDVSANSFDKLLVKVKKQIASEQEKFMKNYKTLIPIFPIYPSYNSTGKSDVRFYLYYPLPMNLDDDKFSSWSGWKKRTRLTDTVRGTIRIPSSEINKYTNFRIEPAK